MSRSRRSYAASGLIAAGLAAIAFGAKGGTELGRTTTVEVVLTLTGAALVCAAVLWARPGPLHGGLALTAMAALTALTALSVLWSIVPSQSFVEAGRMLAYLTVFAAAIAAARLWPRAAPELAAGVLGACLIVAGWALMSRVWPASLAENELYARIGQPFGYWNAVGTSAAMGIPLALWLGARRAASPAARVLAYPALGALILTVVLTQSRGAIAAAIVGVGLWLAIVPLRLRSLPPLLVGGAVAAPVAAWALSEPAFTDDFLPLAVRESVAGDFGLLVLAMLAVLTVAGLALNAGLQRGLWPMRLRRRTGATAIALAAALPLALFTGVAISDRGLGGTISDQVDKLTDESGQTPGAGASRLSAASSSRPGYWREAGRIFGDRPVLGAGAGTFGVARLRYRKSELVSRHAHGFVPQTFADTGILGLAAALALLAAWLAAALRATSLMPRRRPAAERRDWTSERVALVALLLTVVVFGVQSTVDWTWFVTFPAVAALAAAGFLAARGPAAATPEGATFSRTIQPPRGVLAAGIAFAALISVWAIWQPERSSVAADRALELSDDGDHDGAEREARRAADIDPLSSKPPLVLASVQQAAGREADAKATLERAVLRYPSEPTTWTRLAGFQLEHGDPLAAQRTLRGALYLDPKSKTARGLFLQSRIDQREAEQQQTAKRRVR